MNQTESREDYLETILLLMKRNGSVRSIDIANELNYSKPSISRAIGILKRNNYINVDADGQITFTGLGLQHAETVYEKHTNIKKFLISVLKISPKTAEADACRIEHIISDETYGKIREYVENKYV